MLALRTNQFRLISFVFLSCLNCLVAVGAESRPATLDEIQTLFDLAKIGPPRLRVVADITSNEPKYSEQEIAAAIKSQNEMYPDLAKSSDETQRARTNAIARSHSGTRVLHVQEWYSGRHYRLDQTEEGMVSEQYFKKHPGIYKNSFVDIDDPTLSPYRSYLLDNELHDAQLSKTTIYGKNDLWRAAGLEGELAFPLLVALTDSKSGPKGRPATDTDSSTLKIDPVKAEMIHNGSHPIWHLESTAASGEGNRTRFVLRGRTLSLVEPYGQADMEFVYEVGRVGQRAVCVEASLTNLTTHGAFISQRKDFDAQGFPHMWKRTTIKSGSPAKQVDVVFKEVEMNPAFKDEEVFSTIFPNNYIVSDVTSGAAVILQKPSFLGAKATQPLANPSPTRRIIVLCVLGLFALVPCIVLLRFMGNKSKV